MFIGFLGSFFSYTRYNRTGNLGYKIRVNVEKSINHFKDSFCVAGRKTRNEKTLHADLLLAGITQLVTVLAADKIHKHQYIRSLKPLLAIIRFEFHNYLYNLIQPAEQLLNSHTMIMR